MLRTKHSAPVVDACHAKMISSIIMPIIKICLDFFLALEDLPKGTGAGPHRDKDGLVG